MILHSAALDGSIWRRWGTDPSTALALASMCAVYARGVYVAWRHAGTARGIRPAQAASFASGMAVLFIALASPIDAMSDDLFAAHMVQHMLLAVVAPPLLLLGAPVPATLWALPPLPRHRVARWVARTRWRPVWRAMTMPAVAWLAHALAMWAWHMPRLYELALRNAAAHALEHLSFVGTAVMLWWAIVHPRHARRTGYAIGILTLFATAMQTGALGALLTLSRAPWYPVHAAGAAAWGFTALEDQQLAGLIMWVVGGLLYVLAMSVLFIGWLEGPARRNHAAWTESAIGSRARSRRLARSALAVIALIVASSCSRPAAKVIAGGDPERGRVSLAAMGCGACHTIGGVTGAQGQVGPPLDGVGRRSILAGEVANTPENMMRWIQRPDSIEPGTAMPNLHVGPQVARDMVAYLYTLR